MNITKEEATKMAAQLLAPVAQEVTDWIFGDGQKRPKILSTLPNELQSEIALKRAQNRLSRGLEVPPAQPPKKGAALELPAQKSDIRVTTGPKPTT